MNKVFLSYSSKDKIFVDFIANKLGKVNVVYDTWTFESGNKTLDEIYQGIDSSGIFVFFISQNSLESPWVKKEINIAEEYLKNGKLKRFLPLLIDHNAKHSDNRIPQWIKDEYNLKYISKPIKCSDLIIQSLRLVSWELHPKKKEADQLFIGRTSQIKQYEERIYDVDKPIPVGIIVSGLPSIGRRKFIKHVLVNSNKIKANELPSIISMDSRNSIEDLILKLFGLGYSQLEKDHVTNLTTKTIEEKIKIASNLLKELHNINSMLFILDNSAIVSKDGHIVDWFFPIVNNLKELRNLVMCIISQARVYSRILIHNPFIFSIDIPELEPYERIALFKSLLEIENIEIDKDSFKIITDLFSGFPEQILYTTSLIIHEGKNYLIQNPNEIVEYNTEKVARLVKTFESNNLALQILKILSESEFLSLNVIEDILKEDFEEAKDLISQFSNEFIIEYIGNTREFLRLNDSVKDYIQRLGYKLSEKYNTNFHLHVKNAFNDYEIIDRDISDYVISFKEALKENYQVPKELLIPSHYVNAMRELYNYEKRYKVVISLAERILLNEDYLDKKILREIRYWFCLALARRRDKSILKEVQKIDEPDHSFLLGFYYRIIGRHEDAIIKLKHTLDIAPYFYRAKRELIQVYLNTEQYEEAFILAKESYFNDKNNPYHLQSYFRCLIKLKGTKQKDELITLVEELKENPHEKASEMYQTAYAEYLAFVENDDRKALKIANDAISMFPNSMYPYLTKFELLRKVKDISEIEKTIKEVENKFDSEADIFTKLLFLSCKCIWLANISRRDEALNILKKDIKPNFSEAIYSKLLLELDIM